MVFQFWMSWVAGNFLAKTDAGILATFLQFAKAATLQFLFGESRHPIGLFGRLPIQPSLLEALLTRMGWRRPGSKVK